MSLIIDIILEIIGGIFEAIYDASDSAVVKILMILSLFVGCGIHYGCGIFLFIIAMIIFFI